MMNREYLSWLESSVISLEEKDQLLKMSEKEIEVAFGQELKFETAGLRGIMGLGSSRLNKYTIRKVTFALAKTLKENSLVAIAYDNRHHSEEFAKEATLVLASLNIKTLIFEEIHATPELSFLVRQKNCHAGIMITASHNPKEYNGYKVYNSSGGQLLDAEANLIMEEMSKIEGSLIPEIELTSKQEKLIKTIGTEIDQIYYDHILSIQKKPELLKTIKLVYSSQHGAGLRPITEVLKQAGYQVTPVLQQASFDGDFSFTRSPNPEDSRAYQLALDLAETQEADLVLVSDPDADRLGVAVNDKKTYRILTGNELGLIILNYLLLVSDLKDSYVVSTVVSSSLVDKICLDKEVKLYKTLTGFKYIGDLIGKLSDKFLFGFEESSGYLLKDFVRDKDAVQASLIVAEAANYYLSQGKNLVNVLEEIYTQYGHQISLSKSIEFSPEDFLNLDKVMNLIMGLEHLGRYKILQKEDYRKPFLNYPPTKMLKLYFDFGWFILRPSGTEPKCKLYFDIKATEDVELIVEDFFNLIKDTLDSYATTIK